MTRWANDDSATRVGLFAVVGRVQPGLPPFRLPPLSVAGVTRLLPLSASMFLVIVAQSAATARSFAQKHDETLDEDRDLVALGAANAAAALSGTFGCPMPRWPHSSS